MGKEIKTEVEVNCYVLFLKLINSVNYSIDKIKITVKKWKHEELKYALRKKFEKISHDKSPDNEYEFIETFLNHEGRQFQYVYNFDFKRWRNSIVFSQPNWNVQKDVSLVLEDLNITPSLSIFELALDHQVEHLINSIKLIESHLYQKHRRKLSNRFKKSFYSTSTRKVSKNIDVYPKEFDKEMGVRLELRLFRPWIKSKGIIFPIKQLKMNLSECFDFRYIDIEGMRRFLIKKEKGSIEKMDAWREGFGELAYRTIDSYLSSRSYEPLMSQVDFFKSKIHGVENHSRFLQKIDSWNEAVLGERTINL